MSKEERYYFDSYDYIVDRQKIINGEEDITVCDFCDWGKIVDILNEQDQKIADLEAKLVKNKKWLASNEGFLENQKLKQQLAEKEKEIENLNNRILISQLQAPKEQILNILGSQCIQCNPDQDKISLAVEQLEKVKEIINTYNKEHCFLSTEIDTCNKSVEIIDNQIKQLKEMK